MKLNLTWAVAGLAIALTSLFTSNAVGGPTTAPVNRIYQSPYTVKFTCPETELIGDIITGARGGLQDISSIPFDQWSSAQTLKKYGAWGPPGKEFDPPAGIDNQPASFKRQRLIAVALRYEGVSYQHHHLPDWDPPANWPWKEVGHGRNAKGVDCSNFTGLVYNLGLGIRLNTAIETQAELLHSINKGRQVQFERIAKPAQFGDCIKQLRTGDLLFIKNREGEVSHVILWVGDIGQSPDHTPLIIDSTGTGHTDSAGQKIPDGVHLRPFKETSWYWKSLSHIHRVIPD